MVDGGTGDSLCYVCSHIGGFMWDKCLGKYLRTKRLTEDCRYRIKLGINPLSPLRELQSSQLGLVELIMFKKHGLKIQVRHRKRCFYSAFHVILF